MGAAFAAPSWIRSLDLLPPRLKDSSPGGDRTRDRHVTRAKRQTNYKHAALASCATGDDWKEIVPV